jgi:LPXTG-motif cell wall-anchored protein
VGKAMAMSTPAKVAVGVGVIGLLWLMFGKKRRK